MNKYYISPNENEGKFEDYQTIKEKTFEVDFKNRCFERSGLPILSDGRKARLYLFNQPVMVVAGTNAGKTRRITIEYILSASKAGESFIVNDPKAEAYKHCSELLKQEGYRVLVIDFRDPNKGERYNILELPAKLYQSGERDIADEMINSVFKTICEGVKNEKDVFWHVTSATVLAGEALLLCDNVPAKNVTFNNIYNTHIQGGERMGTSNVMKEYIKMHPNKSYCRLIAPYANAATETRASLDAVMISAISPFIRNEGICDQAYNSTFDAKDLVDEKCALFLLTRDESEVSATVSCLIDQLYQRMVNYIEENYSGRAPRKISFIIDEFGNLPQINDINSKITVSRARNIVWMLCCQSLDQINYRYGSDIAKILIGNCLLAYMYSSDVNLLKMISELCGRTIDENGNERPLMSVDKLRHLNKEQGQTLFLLERLNPFVGYLPDISQYGIKPIEKLDLERRKNQKIDLFDFKAMVEKEIESEKNKENRKNKPFFPSFDEFMKNQRILKEDEDDDIDVDFLDFDEELEKINLKIDELVSEIDNDIEHIKKNDTTNLKVHKVCLFNMTVDILQSASDLSRDRIKFLLQRVNENQPIIIPGIPRDKIKNLIKELNSIGTIASEDNTTE